MSSNGISVVDSAALDRLVVAVEGLTAIGKARLEPVPEGCRQDIAAVSACLTMDSWPGVVTAAQQGDVDLRDLVEAEVAYLERVSHRTVQAWRERGDGPKYRNKGSIRYPPRELWEWRRKAVQSSVDQGRTRGRHRS
jgi:hypothetical protein